MKITPLLLILQTWQPAPIPPDSAQALRELAHKAEWSYEYLLRSLAPVRRGGYSGGQNCDEIVGRFCLTYDSGNERRPDATVAGKVISARQQAVEMLRHAFAALPGELTTAGPLLRYLIEDGRADEAIAAARTFAWASGDSAWGHFLVGYALHAAAQDSLAEDHFRRGLDRLPPEARRRIDRVSYLLEPRERSAYEKFPEPERIVYEAALWRLADPLYLTSGNERYAEHLARHVWSRLLAEAPRVRRMYSWGDDLEQLTVRYGVPTSRERMLGDIFSIERQETMVEYYDPEQLAYLPETLHTAGIPQTPPPGTAWILEAERARSGYHPLTIRKLRPLDHQVSRFPAGSAMLLRIDASIALDSVARGAENALAGLFILDRNYTPVAESLSVVSIHADTARLSFETMQDAGMYVYSLELLEESSRFAGRARYAVELPEVKAEMLALSDPVVAAPFGTAPPPTHHRDNRLRPLTSLLVAPNDTIGLYAEAHRLRPDQDGRTHFNVELKVGKADSPPLLARAWGWIGRKLGIAKPGETPRLAWEGEARGGEPAILAVDLSLDGLKSGLYAIELTLTDLVAGETATTTRLIRIRDD
jgi:hypothetical protein